MQAFALPDVEDVCKPGFMQDLLGFEAQALELGTPEALACGLERQWRCRGRRITQCRHLSAHHWSPESAVRNRLDNAGAQ